MNQLLVTVGLPRSGKTTWARAQGLPIVNPDSVRLAIHGQPYFAPAEPLVWAIVKAMVRALFLSGSTAVVLDATNTTRKRRDEWLSGEWETRFVCFRADKELCSRRADLAGRADLIPVIERMAEQFEPISEVEAPIVYETEELT